MLKRKVPDHYVPGYSAVVLGLVHTDPGDHRAASTFIAVGSDRSTNCLSLPTGVIGWEQLRFCEIPFNLHNRLYGIDRLPLAIILIQIKIERPMTDIVRVWDIKMIG
jgi:hypothetical protein